MARRRSPQNPFEWILFSISAVGVFAPFVRWVGRRYKRAASAKWPKISAKCEDATFTKVERGKNRTTWYLLKMRFSYVVAGVEYFGKYSEEYKTPAEVEQMKRSFEEGPLYVRWNPVRPRDYFLDPYRDITPD